MMPTANTRLARLRREFPEWQSWLTVVEAVARESAGSNWQHYVPRHPPAHNDQRPFLTAATLVIEEREICGWLERLFSLAGQGGNATLANLARLSKGAMRGHSVALLQAAVDGNFRHIEEFALARDIDAEGFRAVLEIAPLPLLHACHRCWSALIPEGWAAGYCPICGAWPALAEEQGIERNRALRCARCGAGWRTECLRCAYCSNTEHERLTSLIPESARATWRIDACHACRGYLKTVLVLQGNAPEEILIEDLATVELDVAALEAGYVRPANPGYDYASRRTEPSHSGGRWASSA